MAKPKIFPGGNPSQMTTHDLQQQVRAWSKVANQRMVDIEKSGLRSDAYNTAQVLLHHEGRANKGPGRFRFNKSQTRADLVKEYNMLSKYLLQPSSTLGKTKQIIDARANWFCNYANANKNPGDPDIHPGDLSRQEWQDFFRLLDDENNKTAIGSDNIVELVRQAIVQKVDYEGVLRFLDKVSRKYTNDPTAYGRKALNAELKGLYRHRSRKK